MTFKALCDVVRSQGIALKEIERNIPQRISKAELNSGLSIKANVSDVSRTIAELAAQLESKVSFEDCQ